MSRLRFTRPSSRKWHAAAALLVASLLFAAPVSADNYDQRKAGNPLRIVAYMIHPIGVAIDTLVVRPSHWLVSRQPLKTLFGHTD
jgi:hypothetical protein